MSTLAKAPELVTERLILHGHGLKDFAESAAMWGDPDVVRFIGGRPFTEEECWTRLLRYVGHWAAMGYGFWAIREKATGRFVGEVGFADFRRELDPPFGDTPEMGWALNAWAQGKGLRVGGHRGGAGLGREPVRPGRAHRLHDQPGQRALDQGGGAGRIPRVHSHHLQRLAHSAVPAIMIPAHGISKVTP